MILLNLHDPQYYEQNQLKNLEFLGGNIKVEQKLYSEQDNDYQISYTKYCKVNKEFADWYRCFLCIGRSITRLSPLVDFARNMSPIHQMSTEKEI